jgi:hypothetical protein
MKTLVSWPSLKNRTLEDLARVVEYITRMRPTDTNAFKDLPNQFIMGRKVGRVPSSSADVITGDKVGDFNYDISYIYVLVDNAGTGTWRRATLGSW